MTAELSGMRAMNLSDVVAPADLAGLEVPCESTSAPNRKRHMLPGFDLPAQVFVRFVENRPCCGMPRSEKMPPIRLLCWPCLTSWLSLPGSPCKYCEQKLHRSQLVLSATPLKRAA